MRKFSILLLSVASALTIVLHVGLHVGATEKENATSKQKNIEHVQYMSQEPGGL
ncbi:hypothetical protein [Bacillus mycoides]|uniref:hypothetical protein n=1 Tax=Bacillus mycoides TaxID=1405 RepID=UPI00148522E8|nr:hypothetical protein [Bacillus mycoides]